MLDRRTVLGLGAALAAGPAAAAGPVYADDPTEIVSLWPGAAPGSEAVAVRLEITERSPDPNLYRDRFAVGVSEPLMTVFRPARPTGAAVLVIPGGGYKRVVIDKEGFETARRLAAAGVAAFVLRYRLPADGWAAGPDAPLQDAQRALRIIRADAARFDVDPKRIAVLGFSAGGHLAASLASLHAKPTYAPADARDTVSARPDFSGLMYPVITMARPHAHPGSRDFLLGPAPTEAQVEAWSRERTVAADTPPTFLVHAADDSAVPVENSLLMLAALRAAKVPAELHVFEEGEHGFGVRLIQGKPAARWPDLFLAWGRRHGVF